MSSLILARNGLVAAATLFIAVGFASTAALAQYKTTSKWNATSFEKACSAAPSVCIGGKLASGDYKALLANDTTKTEVRCSAHHCAYRTTSTAVPGDASAKPDKSGNRAELGDLLRSKKR